MTALWGNLKNAPQRKEGNIWVVELWEIYTFNFIFLYKKKRVYI